MPKPDEVFEIDIADLGHDGRGIGRHQGKVCFIPGALSGERVRARMRRRTRQSDEAELLEVLRPSEQRVVSRCIHFGACSGCNLQHLDATAQIGFKQKQLADALTRIGQVEPQRWLPALTAQPWAYRRKARLSVRFVEKKNRVLVGFRETHAGFVADLSVCEVLHPALGPRLGEVSEALGRLHARREIPQLEVCFGDTGWVMVVRHTAPLNGADRAILVDMAKDLGCTLLLQARGPEQLELLHDSGALLQYQLPEYAVSIDFRAMDFIQVNAQINQAMVRQALELLQPQASDLILDLYCGLGNFTLPIARSGATVIGVEGDVGLTRRAAENADRNGLSAQTGFHTADLSVDQRHASWAGADYDRILLDPARAGAQAVFDYLPGKSVHTLVYVSCHPGTLARDAGLLKHQHGFDLVAAGVMDMFPHTAHVESMALFERR